MTGVSSLADVHVIGVFIKLIDFYINFWINDVTWRVGVDPYDYIGNLSHDKNACVCM